MKKYKVKVNGKVYEVELESVEEVKGSIEAPKETAPVAASNVSGEGKVLAAPIGGKVLDVKVSVGQSVKKGDIVCIIEAMKMENEVRAEEDCTIKEVKVNKGAQVANKDPLFVVVK